MNEDFKGAIREYWERQPCGTGEEITGASHVGEPEFFERIEEHRYGAEPFIHEVAQFTRFNGRKLLEIGVGAGTDHLQWARAGAECHGVDLTDFAIETTGAHLAAYGFKSELRRLDAEELPFDEEMFDVVYSWGVIHHTTSSERMVAEVHRVLKPNGLFIGMVYGRHSIAALRLWFRNALMKGRPWRTPANVIRNHMESVGTHAYTYAELRELFGAFGELSVRTYLTASELNHLPAGLAKLIPDEWGWYITIRARK